MVAFGSMAKTNATQWVVVTDDGEDGGDQQP
jgi:hypothetical protein